MTGINDNPLKTLQEKEKFLQKINFYISQAVFYFIRIINTQSACLQHNPDF